MLNNKFDVLFSKATIEWEGIGVSMHHQRELRSEHECNKLENKTMQENKYKFMEAKEITYLHNQKHLDNEEKKSLRQYDTNLMTYLKGKLEIIQILTLPLNLTLGHFMGGFSISLYRNYHCVRLSSKK